MGALVRSQRARRLPLAEPATQLEALHGVALPREFDAALDSAGLWPLRRTRLEILQVNVGKVCNQTCRHCHVDAGPDRKEQMSREIFELCLKALEASSVPVVDITGGAPELNPNFRWFVESVKSLGRHVMDRCNLTILETPSGADLPQFFATHDVEVVCSLPHYRALGTDSQRGDGVFDKSIRALQRLNDVGYGRGAHRLVLVTNPVGAFLPANQASLEREWKQVLAERYDVHFDALYSITNMPISRYLEWLLDTGNLGGYLSHLVAAFNPSAALGVMCRNTLSVGYDGKLYDCDFNQMLELGMEPGFDHIRHFAARDAVASLESHPVRVDRHCFGCTAGAGSSCGGATA